MTECPVNKIDSNVTGLAYAEEECLKQLPENPVWYELEPDTYNDFGAEITTVARNPINQSRQNKKGSTVDVDASGGITQDFTQSNTTRLLQGFYFADARELPTTKPLNAVQNEVVNVVGATSVYNLTSPLAVTAGMLLHVEGFANSANNGLKVVESVAGNAVTVVESLADEIADEDAVISVVGWQFDAADVSIAVTSGIPSLVSASLDFTTFPGLIPGGWLFLGGDVLANRFANNVGYARINEITEDALIFDDTTWSAVDEAGTGKTIRMFYGTVIKNENNPALIKRRSYNIERRLGEGLEGTQAEYLEGAVANEMTLNIPSAEKLTIDLSFVACDTTYRSGDDGDELKEGVRIPAPGEDAYNSTSNIYRLKMAIHDDTTANPTALFGYITEGNISITNNVTPNKAVGVMGAFDHSTANFEVGGSVTAYFSTVAAVKAVRNNADVGLNVILAARNEGFIKDIPLLGLGGGRINVEKDNPVTVPLEPMGAENKHGYTMLYQVFKYLPSVAMPA